MKPIILEVPESFNPLSGEHDAETQDFLDDANLQFSGDIMPGTQAVGGRKIVLAMTSKPNEILALAFDIGLEFTLLHEAGEALDQSEIIGYFLPDVELDEYGDVISETPVTDVTNRVSCWAGQKWEY